MKAFSRLTKPFYLWEIQPRIILVLWLKKIYGAPLRTYHTFFIVYWVCLAWAGVLGRHLPRLGYVNVQSCLLSIFHYQLISLQYSWLRVEQPIRFWPECGKSIIGNFQYMRRWFQYEHCLLSFEADHQNTEWKNRYYSRRHCFSSQVPAKICIKIIDLIALQQTV